MADSRSEVFMNIPQVQEYSAKTKNIFRNP